MRQDSGLSRPVAARLANIPPRNIVNQDAFRFLGKADFSQINWTTAHPLGRQHPQIGSSISWQNALRYKKFAEQEFLKNSIVDYFKRLAIECTPENIVGGSGITDILRDVYFFLRLRENQQQVLLATPTYGVFYKQCQMLEIEVDFLPTVKSDNWQIDPQKLEEKLKNNPHIKVLLVNFPNNPTGKVLTRPEAEAIAEVLSRYPEIVVISDEILCDMILQDDKKHCSLASIPQLKDRVIVLNSPAKSRSMAGIRVAFGFIPDSLINAYKDLGVPIILDGSFLDQVARSLSDSPENQQFLQENIVQYLQNNDHIKSQIDVLNQKLQEHFQDQTAIYVKAYIDNPQAGNAYLLDFSGLREKVGKNNQPLTSGLDVAEFLLEKAGVGLVPGECFFLPADDMTVRMPSYLGEKEIEMGFEKISQAIIENLRTASRYQLPASSPSQGR